MLVTKNRKFRILKLMLNRQTLNNIFICARVIQMKSEIRYRLFEIIHYRRRMIGHFHHVHFQRLFMFLFFYVADNVQVARNIKIHGNFNRFKEKYGHMLINVTSYKSQFLFFSLQKWEI